MGSAEGAKKARESMRKIREDPVVWDQRKRKMYPETYSIKLTDKQECLIYGTLLGDGNITLHANSENPLIQIEHAVLQEEYVRFKYRELENLCKSAPKYVIHATYKSRKECHSIRFQTRSLDCLHQIYDTVRNECGRKTVSNEWIEQISGREHSSLSLAMWYFDDGSIHHNTLINGNRHTSYMSLALGDRTINESILLHKWLQTEFGIESRIRDCCKVICKNGEYQRELRVTDMENMERMAEAINPWVADLPSMDYKLQIFHKVADGRVKNVLTQV